MRIFFVEIFDSHEASARLSGYEMGIFFTIFVMLQFWNLFNAKYFRTGRSLILDIVDLFRAPHRVKESYNKMYLFILGVILIGQVLIVSCAGQLFSVSPLKPLDWLLIIVMTSPVLLIPDLVRFFRGLGKDR